MSEHIQILRAPRTLSQQEKIVAAVYCRVSTRINEQESSIQGQDTYLTQWVKEHTDWTYYRTYAEQISGRSMASRKVFKEMIADALEKRFNLLVVKSVSRFARCAKDGLISIDQLLAAGCNIFFEQDRFYAGDSHNRLELMVRLIMAEAESDSISLNVTLGMHETMRKGYAFFPYTQMLGFSHQKAEHKYAAPVDPTSAVVVKRIFGYCILGFSLSQIKHLLDRSGCPIPGVPQGKNEWHESTIRSILRNEKYMGDVLMHKTYHRNHQLIRNEGDNFCVDQILVEGNHEGIVSKDVFELASERLAESSNGRKVFTRNYPFSARVRCGYCGEFLSPVWWYSGSQKRTLVWRCVDRVKHRSNCPSFYIKNTELESIVRDTLNALAQEYFDKTKLLSVIGTVLQKDSNFQDADERIRHISLWLESREASGLVMAFDEELWYTVLRDGSVRDAGDYRFRTLAGDTIQKQSGQFSLYENTR